MLVYFGGIPGVGKTQLINEIVTSTANTSLPYVKVDAAGIFCEIAEVDNVVALRALPESTRGALRPSVHRKIFEIDTKDSATIRLIDGHYSILDIEGRVYGYPPIETWNREQLLGMFLLTAEAPAIYSRRQADLWLRTDRQVSISSIANELAVESEQAHLVAKQLSKPLITLSTDLVSTARLAMVAINAINCF